MFPFSYNKRLEAAALNHSLYNSILFSGHYEQKGKPYFTGVAPKQRARYSGYLHSMIAENVASAPTARTAVEGLMTAIYHRLAFLHFDFDEIGIGIIRKNGNLYATYLMGNSLLENLCKGNGDINPERFYKSICRDASLKISTKHFDDTTKVLHQKLPLFVIYPYSGAQDVPPVFYEESPDPLPDYTMVGNPLSFELNPLLSPSNIDSVKATLYDLDNRRTLKLLPMSAANDPHKKLNKRQFVFFPLERLQWGTAYRATLLINGSSRNIPQTIEWSFTTKRQPNMITVTQKSQQKIYVKNATKYTLYYDMGTRLHQEAAKQKAYYRTRYVEGSNIEGRVIDTLTYQFQVKGKKGDAFIIENGSHHDLPTVQIIID